MKNKKLVKILATVISCLLLVGAVIGISVSATEAAPEIEYKNLAYEGAVQIVYYVNTGDVAEGYTVKLATWTKADKSDLVIKEAEDFTKKVGEVDYTIFASEGIAPKQMRDTIYAQTVLYNGETEVDRGEIVEYSVYTYVNNRLNKGTTADQRTLYHALVDYGASVQKVLGYRTGKLANEMFDFDYYSDVKLMKDEGHGGAFTAPATNLKTVELTGDDGEVYNVTYVNLVDASVAPLGNSYVYDSHFVITKIMKGDVEVESVVIGGTTYKPGDLMVNSILATGGNTIKPNATFFPATTIVSEDIKYLAVFETNMVVTGENNATWRLYFCTAKANGAFMNPSIPILVRGDNVYFNGSAVAKTGKAFTLRLTTEAAETEGNYYIKIYVNGYLVKQIEATRGQNVDGAGTVGAWKDTTHVVDKISVSNSHSTYSIPHEPTGTIVFSDTTYTIYDYAVPEYKNEAVNKIDYNTLTTSSSDPVTAYVKVSGSKLVNGSASDYDYAITYHKITTAGPVFGGHEFFMGRTKLITSVKAKGSNEETTLTVGSYTYKKGDLLGERKGWDVNGSTLDGDYFKLVTSNTTTQTAPADDATLLYVWDTEMMVASGASGTHQMKVLYGAVLTSSTPRTATDDFIVRTDNNVYYKFNGKSYAAGSADEYFHVRVEIRDLMTPPGTLGADGKTYDPVEISLYINGKLVATRIDEIDAGSGNYDMAPNQVSIESLRGTVDMNLYLANTYLDVYTGPKLDYTTKTNLIGGNKTGIIYLNYDGSTYTAGNANEHNYKVEWKAGPFGTASGTSYEWVNDKIIVGIWDSTGAEVESLAHGSTTYKVGSLLGKTAFGFTNSTFWGNGASLKFYPNATSTYTTTSAKTPLFVFETDLNLRAMNTPLSGHCFNLYVEGGANGTTGLCNVTFTFDGGTSGFVQVCAATAGGGIGAATKLDVRAGASFGEKIHVVIKVTENAEDSSKMDVTYTFSFTNAGASDATKTPFTTSVTLDKADVTRVAVTDVSSMRSLKATFTNTLCYKRVDAE